MRKKVGNFAVFLGCSLFFSSCWSCEPIHTCSPFVVVVAGPIQRDSIAKLEFYSNSSRVLLESAHSRRLHRKIIESLLLVVFLLFCCWPHSIAATASSEDIVNWNLYLPRWYPDNLFAQKNEHRVTVKRSRVHNSTFLCVLLLHCLLISNVEDEVEVENEVVSGFSAEREREQREWKVLYKHVTTIIKLALLSRKSESTVACAPSSFVLERSRCHSSFQRCRESPLKLRMCAIL